MLFPTVLWQQTSSSVKSVYVLDVHRATNRALDWQKRHNQKTSTFVLNSLWVFSYKKHACSSTLVIYCLIYFDLGMGQQNWYFFISISNIDKFVGNCCYLNPSLWLGMTDTCPGSSELMLQKGAILKSKLRLRAVWPFMKPICSQVKFNIKLRFQFLKNQH